jgi:pyruvate ferredoxin oxidoreductase alpha subunit
MKTMALTGAHAVSEAMRQINPDVVAAFPITPQTEIMETFATFANNGLVHTELIRVESEHSAMSAVVGASAAGARAMTATSSQGLALMWEIVYITASLRLPVVMPVVNRALSGPINIHCDHSDTMGCRDSGWIQIYAENAQEAYENTILAMRIAEHPEILLPVMVCQDGFITSHSTENVNVFDDDVVKNFVGEYKPDLPLLDIDHPKTMGALDFHDYYFEHKRQQIEAMEKAKKIIPQIMAEFNKITGRKQGWFEKYRMDDAEYVIVLMNSTAGTAKVAIDEMRSHGKKVGLLKLNVFRPFPAEELAEALQNVKAIGVLDRAASFGAEGGPIFMELKSAMYNAPNKPKIISYIYGLGGRDTTMQHITHIFEDLPNSSTGWPQYIGVRE